MKIGIDRLSFFIPNLYLDMTELAESRGDDPAKYQCCSRSGKICPVTCGHPESYYFDSTLFCADAFSGL